MEAISGLLSALGLSTAAGLNAYIPLLVVGLVGRYTDLINLKAPFDMLENPIVLLIIAIIALADLIGDKIPAVDHVLHLVGVVIHPIAGAILALAATSNSGEISPILAAVSGVVLALGTHGVRATARPLATASTAGTANPVLSFAEDGVSLVLSFLAVWLPVLGFILAALMLVAVFLGVRSLRRRYRDATGKNP